jgi:hypothetical protein
MQDVQVLQVHLTRDADAAFLSIMQACALIWGAHMHIQLVTASDFLFYLLKYAMKTEPTGLLNLDDHASAVLGIPEAASEAGLERTYLEKLIGAYISSTVISPSLAWLTCMQIPTVRYNCKLCSAGLRWALLGCASTC